MLSESIIRTHTYTVPGHLTLERLRVLIIDHSTNRDITGH